MGIKSSGGQSSVNLPTMSHSSPIKTIDGKKIVNKPINRHGANPGFKSKGM